MSKWLALALETCVSPNANSAVSVNSLANCTKNTNCNLQYTKSDLRDDITAYHQDCLLYYEGNAEQAKRDACILYMERTSGIEDDSIHEYIKQPENIKQAENQLREWSII